MIIKTTAARSKMNYHPRKPLKNETPQLRVCERRTDRVGEMTSYGYDDSSGPENFHRSRFWEFSLSDYHLFFSLVTDLNVVKNHFALRCNFFFLADYNIPSERENAFECARQFYRDNIYYRSIDRIFTRSHRVFDNTNMRTIFSIGRVRVTCLSTSVADAQRNA